MKEIKVKCLGCGSLEGGDFCGTCHTVLPIEGGDIDFFQLFGLTPRPHVDQEALKASFYNLSQTLHPDRNLDEDQEAGLRVLAISAQLNRGYKVLTNTKERLRYLVGRETDHEPMEAKQVPAEIMELFFEAHDLMQEVDAHLKQRKPTASRIVAALAAVDEAGEELLSAIDKTRDREKRKVEAIETEIRDLDAKWDESSDRDGILTRLTQLADMLAYLTRLRNSLDEKELALRT